MSRELRMICFAVYYHNGRWARLVLDDEDQDHELAVH